MEDGASSRFQVTGSVLCNLASTVALSLSLSYLSVSLGPSVFALSSRVA